MKNETRFNPQIKLALHDEYRKFINGQKVYPINVEVSPTQVCNAQCDWCFYAGTHEKMTPEFIMSLSVAQELIDGMVDTRAKALTWTGGGEPTLHPQFRELSDFAATMGLKQGLFTNALQKPKYNPENFQWIRVSNTNMPWKVDVLKELRDRTKVLGMALNYTGEHQEPFDTIARATMDRDIVEAQRVADEVGVDYLQIRQALALRGSVTDRLPPRDAELHPRTFVTTYKFDDSANPHGYERCFGFNFVPFVWHNGSVDVCGYHPGKGEPYTLGSLKDKSWKQIFDEAPRDVPVIDSCQVCCKNHEINKFINIGLSIKDGDFV